MEPRVNVELPSKSNPSIGCLNPIPRHSGCLEKMMFRGPQVHHHMIKLNISDVGCSIQRPIWWLGRSYLSFSKKIMELSLNLLLPRALLSARPKRLEGSISSTLVMANCCSRWSPSIVEVPKLEQVFYLLMCSIRIWLALRYHVLEFCFWVGGHHHLAFPKFWCFGKGDSWTLTASLSWSNISPTWASH